jgi:hypothetical protein
MRRSVLAVLVLSAVVLSAACASATSPTAAAPQPGANERGAFGAAGGTTADASKGSAPNAVPAAGGIPTLSAVDRDLILTANISFRSRDPWATADKARAIAAGLGGDLLALSQTGSGEQRSALLTIRVPSSRFDDALSQLKQLDGEVLTSNIDAKDVTDQYVDLQARLGAKKAEEQQYLTLFARANTVDEILKVQSALSSVRLQIEQLQGQVNSLKTRVDFSTITMSVGPIVTVPGPQVGTWDPARTFAQAVAALSSLFRVIGDAAIWLMVFIWVPFLALVFTVIATRIRRNAPAS